MLNLSDKELDRLARQAANEYDPGDLASRGHWDKLEAGLNRELGRVRSNPFRLIRRIPFYYAPAILLLVGVSYYFIRQGKSNGRLKEPTPAAPLATAKTESSGGSPPLAVVKPVPRPPGQGSNQASANFKFNPDKSTSTPEKENGAAANGEPVHGNRSKGNTPNGNTPNGAIATDNGSNPGPADGIASNGAPANGASSSHAPANHNPGSTNGSAGRSPVNGNSPANGGTPITSNPEVTGEGSTQNLAENASHGTHGIGHDQQSIIHQQPVLEKELASSAVQDPLMLSHPPAVDDSGLRDFSAADAANMVGPITLGKSNGPFTRINRPLQFGLSLAPDFASVNSLAGDRPGSSIGITIDYQFTNRLYLSTGLLFSRKNYTATTEDYHVPYGYYSMNNMHDVNFVKGSFNLLEIPLNLRYDFSVSGNTVFFASGGLSSYLMTTENCNYYYTLFGRETSREFKYSGNGTQLFSAVNLSMGVETGLTNELSLLIAPYVKIPTGGLGFGRIEMNSLGVNFSLKYSPVLKRTRHR